MHPEALAAMVSMIDQFAARFGGSSVQVLDVGSQDVNGSYRPTIEDRGWHYTGLDIVRGKNVNVVSPDPYRYPIGDCRYDLVISGGTMEHVQSIWLWVPELVRVCRPGGMIAIVTHWSFPEHKEARYPLDCWRIMPDGLRFLFEESGELEEIEVSIVSEYDIAGSAWKSSGGSLRA